ncbi:MAG: DNA gyrase subunit A, partial [Mycoplasmataceae bacterium]|nr:DNA gyrase subunit A [Mycoplasmataceae bacterium]
RIIYAAHELGMKSDKPYKKSARLVGEVIGKFHPHGDTAVYETVVRMAQDFSIRYPLIDGHGNFGSIDGDGAAAMRYTEVRLAKIAEEFLRDIDKEVVTFVDNYDGSEQEPAILPSLLPNLLMNGSVGISVGMTTSIPTHNLTELLDASIALIKDPSLNLLDLMQYLKGPDFPTAAYIIGDQGIKDYFTTGHGSLTIRSKVEIKEKGNKNYLIVSEIPYLVNKASLVEEIAQLVHDKEIEGISDIKDESNRDGIRILIELKKDAIAEVVLNHLYKKTKLQTNFSVHLLSLYNGKPVILNIKEIINVYNEFQILIVRKRLQFQLKKASERVHYLEGLEIALDHLDAVINIIRHANDKDSAAQELMNNFHLSEIQAKAILEMKLQSLTGLEKSKILDELKELRALVVDLKDKLSDEEKIKNIVIDQMNELKTKYGDKRKTEILANERATIDDESLIPVEDVVVSLSKNGYLKRLPIDTYKLQNRGGVGVIGVSTHADDDIKKIIYTNTHVDLLFFTNLGKVYKIRVHQLPVGSRTAKGIPALNYIPLEKNEVVLDLLPIKEYNDEHFILFATKKGLIKRTSIQEFESIRQNGKIAISLREDDELLSVILTSGNDEIILASSDGYAVRFDESKLRPTGRAASGVKGINLSDNAYLISCDNTANKTEVLSIGSKGFGKLSSLDDYRLTNRGAKGVRTLKINDKTGSLVASLVVNSNEELLILTKLGKIIRLALNKLRVIGRSTSGVKLINLDEHDKVISISVVDVTENKTDDINNEQNETVLEENNETNNIHE